MSIRPFELRDIGTLNRYREQGLFLDSIPTLTWGHALVPAGAMLSPVSSTTGVFTSLYFRDEEDQEPLVGQVVHNREAPLARFTFLAPDAAVESPALPALVESLIERVGERGAQSLIAEVDERTQTFEAMRNAGFSIYSRQRIWKLAEAPPFSDLETPWRHGIGRDEIAVRTLYNNLVPRLVQQVEPDPWGGFRGRVFFLEGELRAFVDVHSGPRGIWVQPFFHPETQRVTARLSDLLNKLRPRASRPVYVCVRSYESWLEAALEDLEAEVGPRQAVMAKRLAAPVRKPELTPVPQINRNTEPTIPYSNSIHAGEEEREAVL